MMRFTQIEYWIGPSVPSKLRRPSSSCEEFHVKLQDYTGMTLCLSRNTVMSYKFLDNDSKLIVHEADGSVRVAAFSNLAYTTLTGHIVGYESSSWASGVLRDGNRFTGTIRVNDTVLYVEDLRDYDNALMVKVEGHPNESGMNRPDRRFYCPGGIHVKVDQTELFKKVEKICATSNTCNSIPSFRVRERQDYSGVEVKLSAFIDTAYFKYSSLSSEEKAIESVLKSIEAADAIFRSTDFMGKGQPNNVGLRVVNISLYKRSAPSPLPEFYPFHKDPEDQLDRFDNDINLLAVSNDPVINILYSGQSFNMAVGLAFKAADVVLFTVRSSGAQIILKVGVCAQVNSRENPEYFTPINNFNALFVTGYKGYSQRSSQLELDLTVTHELGHIFGADHDDEQKCGYGYVMADRIANWRVGNRHKFSNCSKRQIHKVLLDRYLGCLSVPSHPKSICGNKLKEVGEDCDCGDKYECDHTKSCCFPHGSEEGTPCTVNSNCTSN